MTAPVRRYHAIIWSLLAVLLPIVWLLALWSRHVVRSNPNLRWEQLQ